MPIATSREAHLDALSVSTLQLTIQIDVNDTVILTQTNSHGSDTTTAPTDTGGNTYTKVGSSSPNTTVVQWRALNVSNSATSVTFNQSTTDNLAVAAETYTGVSSIGVSTTNSGVGTSGTISLTTQDANNYIVASITNLGNATGFGATNGTFRTTAYFNNQGSTLVSLMDNTAAAAQSVTCSWNWTTSGDWGAVAVELRAGSTPTPSVNDTVTTAESVTMHMPISLRMGLPT